MAENTVSFIDLVNLFKKKFVKIVIIAVIAAIIGGAVGGLMAVLNATYDAELEIYVTPADGSDRLLYDLRSGRFAEQLLLEKTGLPAKDKCNAADYDAALKALEELADIRQKRIDKHEEISRYYTSDIEHQYSVLSSEYDRILGVLKTYKDAQTDALVNEEHQAMIAYYEERLREAEEARDDYYDNHYSPVVIKKLQLNTELAQLTDELDDKREEVDEAVEKVLAAWRNDPEVAKEVKAILQCVTYEYHKLGYFEDESQNKNEEEDNESLHRGYIKIKISVPRSAVPDTVESGEAYAQLLIDRYNSRVADYVENYLEEATGVYEAKCTVISPIVEIELGSSSMLVEMVKFAAIAGVIFAVLAYLFYVAQMMMKRASVPAGREVTKNNASSAEDNKE